MTPDFSSHLDAQLSFQKCLALPSLVRDPLRKFFMQLLVDDMLGAGSFGCLTDSLTPALELKYKVKIQVLQAPDDSITFLKRHHTLLSHGRMLLQPSNRRLRSSSACLVCPNGVSRSLPAWLLCLTRKMGLHSSMQTMPKSFGVVSEFSFT